MRFALSFFVCLFVFSLMGKAKSGGDPVAEDRVCIFALYVV